ncbi:MAG: hypothetical protein K6G87_06705 [Butyrivibrio sp.]|nr:hypothetical protein [Butyrivibrio sp.]MCR5770909.1 hypothetical protein [Butyrivibrio sp.]
MNDHIINIKFTVRKSKSCTDVMICFILALVFGTGLGSASGIILEKVNIA